MKLCALILMLLISMPTFAQAEPTATASAPAESESADAGPALTGPFSQDDLELLVGNVQRPNGIVWFEDSLFTVCNGDWTVYKIDDETGDTITFVFGIRDGNSLVIESTDAGFDLWVPDPDNGALWKVDQQREAPVRVNAILEAPWGIARLDDSSFLVTDTSANSILQVSEAGEITQVQDAFRAPTGIALHDNRIYVANGGSARRGIEYVEIAEDGSYSEVQSLVAGLQNTTNIIMGSDGYLYFSYALGTRGVVGRVKPESCLENSCDNDDIELVVFSDIPAPLAITISEDLRLFLHSRFRPEIYWAQVPT